MRSLLNIVRYINSHPLVRHHQWSAFVRFLKWQIASRLMDVPLVMPYVNATRLVVRNGMTGATGNIYVGLMEFEDMGFLLHVLRPSDLFIDIGANVGVYTVLSSGAAGARTISIEPLPEAIAALSDNIAINRIGPLVEVKNIGVSSAGGALAFTTGFDTQNHVALADRERENALTVRVEPLDEICKTEIPLLLKMDVEGFEAEVIKGGMRVLADTRLKALIVELNGSCRRYGVEENDIHHELKSIGFNCYRYDPFRRELRSIDSFGPHNTLYVRDLAFIDERVKRAKPFKVLGQTI